MMFGGESLNKHVNNLIVCGNVSGDNSFIIDLVTNEVAIDLHVFGSYAQHQIGFHGKSGLVIAVQDDKWEILQSHVFRSVASQMISHEVTAIERYLASIVERSTTDYFFVFHEIGEEPRRIQ